MTIIVSVDIDTQIEAAVTLAERMDWLDEVSTHAPAALIVATKLAHKWIDKKTGGFTIGQEAIAEKHGIPLRSVQRQMAALKVAGLLVQKRRYHKCPVTFLVLDPQENAAVEPEINPPSVAGSLESQPAKLGEVNPPHMAQSTRQPQIGDQAKSEAYAPVSRDLIPSFYNPSAAAPRSGESVTTATRGDHDCEAEPRRADALNLTGILTGLTRRKDGWDRLAEAERDGAAARDAGEPCDASHLTREDERMRWAKGWRDADRRHIEETQAALANRHLALRDEKLAYFERLGRECAQAGGMTLDEIGRDLQEDHRASLERGWAAGIAEQSKKGAGAS